MGKSRKTSDIIVSTKPAFFFKFSIAESGSAAQQLPSMCARLPFGVFRNISRHIVLKMYFLYIHYILLRFAVFHDAASISDYRVCRRIVGWLLSDIGWDLEGPGLGLIEVQSWHLPGWTEWNQDSLFPGWDASRIPIKYGSSALPLLRLCGFSSMPSYSVGWQY
jgi:hypothetical protein